MKRIALTQGLYALVDDEDFEFLSQWKWYAHRSRRTFYAVRNRRKADGPGPGLIRMHRVILNPPDGMETDHINGKGLDNRRKNLRAVTRVVNSANHVHQKRNRKHDLPMGVYPHKEKFVVQIGIDGYRKYLGLFNTPDDAHAAYICARTKRIAEYERRDKTC